MRDRWLPEGYEFADGESIQTLLFSAAEWQIYGTEGLTRALLARPALARKWWASGLLDESLFEEVACGPERYACLRSHVRHALAPVYGGAPPNDKADALAFAIALKRSRARVHACSFHDAVYVEQFSRLLPVWTSTQRVPDDWLLGTWLTGGIVTSTASLDLLGIRMGWGTPAELTTIIEAAGLPLSAKAPALPAGPQRGAATLSVDSASAPANERLEAPKAGASARIFSLPGRPQLEAFFQDHVIDIIVHGDKYRAFGIEFPAPILLHGPPGSGKTFAVERLAEFLDLPRYEIDSSSVGSQYIHGTSQLIATLFERAAQTAPAVILIDEVEAFLSDRRRDPGGYRVEEVAEFLRRIPEASANKVLVIAMTNMIDRIDPAILRHGRFDHVIEVSMPVRAEVAAALDCLLAELPKADDIDLDPLLDALTGKSLADAAFIVREAARRTVRSDQTLLTQKHLVAALASLQAHQVPAAAPVRPVSNLFAL